MSDIKEIKFNLIKVTTEQFAVLDIPSEDQKIIFNSSFKFGLSFDSKRVGVFTNFSYLAENIPFLLLESGCHFTIADDYWEKISNNETKSVLLPKGFVSHLLMLSVGTARGILHAKTENTPYNEFLIPLINVADAVKNDIELFDKGK